MQNVQQPPVWARDHTILGICEALGEDLGFNPVFLRVPLAVCLLLNPWAVHATGVRTEIWARTEQITDSTGRRLHCYLDDGEELALQIRHTAAGELVAALQEEGITVFLAGDEDALALSVGRYLTEAGFLTHPEDVRPEAIAQAPPESLDPDAIFTGDRPPADSPATSNEQRETTEEVATT